jgi:hypothetical protein
MREIGRRRFGFLRWQSIHGPDGSLYLKRLWLIKTPWFAVMLHWILRPDYARDLHDHPWWFIAFVLRGGYRELLPGNHKGRLVRFFNFKPYGPRGAHCISYVSPNTLTLVIRGRKQGIWGFYTADGFIDSETYEEQFGRYDDEWTRMSLQEWQEEGQRLFGDDVNNWQFVCPNCGHVQTRRDWLELGMSGRQVDERLGFTCIGRWLDPMDAVGFGEMSQGKGCKYAGTMEPNISPITVVISFGEERPTFGFAQNVA